MTSRQTVTVASMVNLPRRLLFSICIIGLYAGETAAQVIRSDDLLGACSLFEKPSLSVLEAVTFEQCRSYIAGFYDGWTTSRLYSSGPAAGSDPYVDVCFPVDVGLTYQQMARIVVHWLREHPETHHLPAWQGARAAFGHAFPCQ